MIIKKGKKKKEKEKAGVTIFVSDKIDFKIKIAKKSLYNNKGINIRGYSIHKILKSDKDTKKKRKKRKLQGNIPNEHRCKNLLAQVQ